MAAVAYAAWLAIGTFGRPYNFFDMKIYHGAVVWWASGHELYEFIAPGTTLGFTYPPFAGLVMLPMAQLPIGAAGMVNAAASIAALALVLAGLLRPIVDRLGWPLWFTVAVAVPLAVAIEPGRETLGYGQVNILLFALIMADLIGLRCGPPGRALRRLAARPAGLPPPRRRPFIYGGALGAAPGPAPHRPRHRGQAHPGAVHRLPADHPSVAGGGHRHRHHDRRDGGTFAIVGDESRTYFGSVLWQTERVGAADMTPNQSLAGLLARLYDSIETPGLLWLAFSCCVLALGLSRARSRADGDELTAFTLVGLTANVISPISWTHHLVWVIPAIIVLADAAVRRREASRGCRSAPARGRSSAGYPGSTGSAPDLVPDADRAPPTASPRSGSTCSS